MDLKDIGITEEELQNRVVERICSQMLEGVSFDEDGDEHYRESRFAKKLQAAVNKQIDDTVTALAEKHVFPNVTKYVEELTLQETNKWGEKTGKPITFIEYLTQRADAFMREEVNHNGKTRNEDSYSWRARSTRIAYMVHEHLQYSIDAAMKKAMAEANSSIAKGLEGAVKLALEQATQKLKVAVSA